MTVAPTAAHGAVVELQTDDDPLTFEPISGVHNGPNGPGFNPILLSARHHGTEDTLNKVSTIEKTPCSFDIYYDSNDPIHAALLTASKTGTRQIYRVTLTDTGAEKYVFGGFIQMTPSAQIDGFNIMSVNITVDGSVTVS